MSRHDDAVRLRHMLNYAREAIVLLRDKTRSDLDRERLLQLGLVRLIEIVGGAASRVSSEAQSRHPEILWPQIISTRNRLIHGYDFVDFDILWQTVKEALPALVAQLEKIVSEETGLDGPRTTGGDNIVARRGSHEGHGRGVERVGPDRIYDSQ